MDVHMMQKLYSIKMPTATTATAAGRKTETPVKPAFDQIMISKETRAAVDAAQSDVTVAPERPGPDDTESALQDGGTLPSYLSAFSKLVKERMDLTKDRSTWPTMQELELEANQATRLQTEETIDRLLAERGITIPEGQSFRLTVREPEC